MKTALTNEIEKMLCERANRNCQRFALEVSVPGGICDFVTVNFDMRNNYMPIISCYEIKISYADFKSENGHNMVGDYNYYVMPKTLYDESIKNKEMLSGAGLLAYSNKSFYEKVLGKRNPFYAPTLSLDEKFKIADHILMRWTSGGMYKDLKNLGVNLRHWKGGAP